MKKLFTLFCCASVIFLGGGSCSSSDDEDIEKSKLAGQWQSDKVNGQPVLTDETHILEFKTNPDVEMYASLYPATGIYGSWQEKDNYSYQIKGSKVTLSGHDTDLIIEIQDIDGDSFTYKTLELSINGKTVVDEKVYTMKRTANSIKEQLVGLWKGHETTEGVTSSEYDSYWDFASDNTFDYYFYENVNGTWKFQKDEDDSYYVYGNFIASNFSLFGTTDIICQCWNAAIEGDTMVLSALRSNGSTQTYRLVRCAQLPE